MSVVIYLVHNMNKKENNEIYSLGVLQAIGERSDVSQRRLAQRLGVALGLVNSYTKRCIRKGWVKAQQVPGNRYLYYLTPKGFLEKSRLSASYLSASMDFYRRAGSSCLAAFDECDQRGWHRIALCGVSDLAEIAFIRSQEHDIEILGFIDFFSGKEKFLGHTISRDASDLADVDGFVLTDLDNPTETFERLCGQVDENRILVPGILEWRPQEMGHSS